MSRQSKNAKNLARARDFSKIRKEGGRSASKTTPKHGKVRAWWQVGDFADFAKGKRRQIQTQAADAE